MPKIHLEHSREASSGYLKRETEPLYLRTSDSESEDRIKNFTRNFTIMKTVITVVAFIFACSLLLSEFTQEAEGIGFIIEIANPNKKKASSSTSNSGGRRKRNKNRVLKHKFRQVLTSLKKSQKRERMLRRLIRKVSLLVDYNALVDSELRIEVYNLLSQTFRQAPMVVVVHPYLYPFSFTQRLSLDE